jgi:hypothetical protein
MAVGGGVRSVLVKTDPISAAHAYRMALIRILEATTIQDVRKRANAALDITFDKPESGVLSVSSGYGQNTKQPFVTIALASPVETANPAVQLLTSQAREIAMQILEAADAAESDGFVVGWLTDVADLSEAQAAALLQEFRAYRDARRKE